jgi:hypothetical protein
VIERGGADEGGPVIERGARHERGAGGERAAGRDVCALEHQVRGRPTVWGELEWRGGRGDAGDAGEFEWGVGGSDARDILVSDRTRGRRVWPAAGSRSTSALDLEAAQEPDQVASRTEHQAETDEEQQRSPDRARGARMQATNPIGMGDYSPRFAVCVCGVQSR